VLHAHDADCSLLALGFHRAGDWFALFLVASVTGLYVANEMRDVMLCSFLVRQRVQDATPAWIPRALFVLSFARQFGFLPRLAATIPVLVFWKGATAVDIFLNAVAVLFLLDLDNAIFSYFVSEETRIEVEVTGRPAIGEDERRMLSRTKHAHAVGVALVIPLSVGIVLLGINGDLAASSPSMNAFILCAAVDARSDSTRQKHTQFYMALWVMHLASTAYFEYRERHPSWL
jgi:hypothetical protein